MLSSLRHLSLAALAVSVAISAEAADGDWPTFRGADRTATAPDTGLLKTWPENGPKLLWQTAGMGRGYASPAIADGKIYTMGDGLSTVDNADEYLICINQSDGKEQWRTKLGDPWTSGPPPWQSSRSTPTVDGDSVYALTADGLLIKMATKDGQEKWRKNLKEEFGGKKADSWGYSESVLIDGNHLICTPGGEKNTMIALDKNSGELIWGCSRPGDRGAGHASIVISHPGGKKVYVTTTGTGAMAVDPETGTLLWDYEITKTTAVIPTPIVKDDLVFFTAGYGTGGALVRQITDGDAVKIEEIYPSDPKLQNKHGGVILIGDHLYGDSGDSGTPFCADLVSGEVLWKSRGAGKKSACVAAADGHLYFRYQDGTMTLVKASPDELQEVGEFKIPGSGERPSWSHPVISQGKLYLREGDNLLCYSLK
ncbi:PQQ-like beta-propeller repeat protein [bacterium]|nr:PQQ-like beta-propeller repeat protein [bacterium]MDC0278687.1 PQQ-like beta-propeller repeat protein [bacterium]